MRGFCHWAGWEPGSNVDCGVLEFDKTEHCLSDSQLTASEPRSYPDPFRFHRVGSIFFLAIFFLVHLYITIYMNLFYLLRI